MRGFTHEELLREVLVAPRDAFTPLPDMQIVRRPGWSQIITPSFRDGGLNEVSYCVLDEGETDAAIDDVIATYARLGARFRWTVGPDSRPADLGARLLLRGLTRSVSHGMVRDTSPLDSDVEATLVDGASIGAFNAVMAEGWSVAQGPLEAYNRLLLREPERNRLFLATVDGEPAAIASYIAFPRSAYFLGGVVLPRFRGRGAYRGLTAARLADARARGLELATSHARAETSAPMLAHFGFRQVCELEVYAR